jgi:hypothetical protein
MVQFLGGVTLAGILRDVNLVESSGVSFYSFFVDVIDWNGEMFGIKVESWALMRYKGSRRMQELTVLPLRECPDPEKLKSDLIARGRIFERLRGYHFLQCCGKASITTKSTTPYEPPVRSYHPVCPLRFLDILTHHVSKLILKPDFGASDR